MRISGSIQGPSVAELLDGDRLALSADLRAGMAAATVRVQGELRDQVRAAGLGPKLEKAWQRQDYPKGASRTLNPAGLVYSKSTILHAVFAEGATITARSGRYLAIPTREAEALGFATTATTRAGGGTGSIPRRSSMVRDAIARLGEANTRTVSLQSGRKLIVYRVPAGRGAGKSFRGRVGFRRGVDVPLFILVPQVRLAARLDVESVRQRAPGVLAAEMTAALAR